MKEQIKGLVKRTLDDIAGCASSADIERVRLQVLGKKGELTGLLRGMGALDASERPAMGQLINDARGEIEVALEARASSAREAEKLARLESEGIDVTLPAPVLRRGSRHPLSIVQSEIETIFSNMGFRVASGPEVEWDKYNFELLNVPKNHPARDMQDTFFLSENIVLRTQTSPVQARTMLSEKPPIRVICPGRVFRSDEVDASHSPVFHQVEGLVVDEGITMGDLKGTLDVFAKALYGDDVTTRFRPSFFPFTEPSAEVDVTCSVCRGKGCRVCKGTGWVEILGAGMVNPKVLSMCGIDPDKYTGFAFGMGIERITLIKYAIPDMRMLWENDMRFVSQFK